ncbi:TauD/TfdA-like domain containing protein [uncultured Caudovirales phage]|uniref:TauD/TfdA-like domain containing protein n=1 Tax=uncultured Caudovirales phage TaxID=2100421 RepID=A0A6J5ND07_9CAUD|nr:TauD/TfdA-like domain containing protein [uncultured Caudovirales phage]
MRITEKNQYIVDYPGINKVEENISEYVDIFNQYGILCFRGARLDDEEAVLVLDVMSKHFSWTPYSINTKNNGPTWKYTQNYDSAIAVDESLSLDESNNLMINRWHTEGVYSKNPHRAAGWNMRNFKCDSKFGQTGFVNASEIVKDMPSELVEFLRSAELMHYPPIVHGMPTPMNEFVEKFTSSVNNMEREIWCNDGPRDIPSYPHPAIEIHEELGCEVLRLCPCVEQWGPNQVLFSVNGDSPTSSDLLTFNRCVEWLENALSIESNHWWHEWEEGDFLIPDLFVMIHSARAGFGIGDREFDGFWCFEKGTDSPPDGVIKARQ